MNSPIRRGSGGAGRQRGGDGVVRRMEFLRPLTLSLLTQRRGPHPPYGMAGGEPGALGRNRLATRRWQRLGPWWNCRTRSGGWRYISD